MSLDPWQSWFLVNALGTEPDGTWAASDVGLIVSRQNGKGVSIDDSWVQALGDVPLTYFYRTLNRLVIMLESGERGDLLPSKGEQDTAWAVKQEYERRKAEGGNVF